MRKIKSMLFLFCFGFYIGSAQYNQIEIAVDGFTCSMCGLGVEKAILQLDFVKEIKMDLNTGIALVYLKENKKVSILKLADKIYKSGFSVRYIHADYNFPALSIADYSVYKTDDDEFHFLEIGQNNIKGVVTISFLNKKLTSKKDYTHWQRWVKEDLKKNGKKDNVYYITLLGKR